MVTLFHFFLLIMALSNVRSMQLRTVETSGPRPAPEKVCNMWPFTTRRGSYSGLNEDVIGKGYNKLVSPPPKDGDSVVSKILSLSIACVSSHFQTTIWTSVIFSETPVLHDLSMTLDLDMTINYGWQDTRLALEDNCWDILNLTQHKCRMFEKQIPFPILQESIWTPPMQVR